MIALIGLFWSEAAHAQAVTFDPPTRIATFGNVNNVSAFLGAQGDFDEDGNLDVVVVKAFTFIPPQQQQTRLVVLFGSGSGGVQSSIELRSPGARDTFSVKTGDVNSDGHLDIVTANNNSGPPAPETLFL